MIGLNSLWHRYCHIKGQSGRKTARYKTCSGRCGKNHSRGVLVMKNFNLKKALIGSAMGALMVLGTASFAAAQNTTREYREYQQAVRQAQREEQDYLRTRNRRDYNQWQAALRRAERQRIQYERTSVRTSNGWNNNAGYNTGRTNYRIFRNGSYYTVDSRGAELLRSAVNNGYSQGYRQGQLDRQRRRGMDWGVNSVYRSGSYGYQSYVARDQYTYYFQQGFQKGYEDGYNSTYRYGTRVGNGYNILGNVLSSILSFVD
jgi:hypothetical protein